MGKFMTEENRDTKPKVTKGYFESGLPYFRIGSSPRILVVFDGLSFENKPPSGLMLRMSVGGFKRIAKEYSILGGSET